MAADAENNLCGLNWSNPWGLGWPLVIIFSCIGIALAVVVTWAVYLFGKEIVINAVSPEFRVDSATLSQLKLTAGSELTATWNVTVVVVNTNILGISFLDNLQATIFYQTNQKYEFDDTSKVKVMLVTKPLCPPSPLNKKTQTTLNFKMETVSAYLGDETAKEISEGRARGWLRFELNMLGRIRYVPPEVFPISFRISCSQVEFGFPPGNWTGTLPMTGQSRSCYGGEIISKYCVL